MLCFTINRGCITILLCRAPANRQNMAAVDATQVPATALNTIGREPRADSLQWITLPGGQLLVVLVRSGLCRATCITCAVPWPRSLTCVDRWRETVHGNGMDPGLGSASERCIHAGVHQEKAGTASSCPNAAAARSFLIASVTSTHLPQSNHTNKLVAGPHA
jgi:hypothetical protein